MGGLKTVWITIGALFLMAACVPQTKQTECSSNEAFNASLRSCVPVIGGPSSFITVKTFSPALPVSVYKNDSNIIPLSVTVANPFSQDYTIEWERVYFGSPSFFAGNTLTTAIIPLTLASELGPHFITAKIVAAGTVVDSHTFQINVSDTPRPVVVSTSVTPSTYAVSLTPVDGAQQFSLTVNNNGAVVSGAGYTTSWTVTKNGANLPAMAESDTFTNVGTTSTNTFYLGTSGSPTFIPANLGVGSYIVKATIGNSIPGEIVGEQQWSVTITHPSISNITSRNLYSATTTPSYSTTVVAYDGLAYDSGITFGGVPINFVPTGQTTQADFCVTVADGEGTYTGDTDFVRVDYYLDNITLIHSDVTSAVDNKLCLTDDVPNLSLVLFNNTTSTTAQTHTLVARVFDEATNTEYTQSNMTAGLGTYPITWNLNVKPQNSKPAVAFFPGSATCAANAGNPSTEYDCSVTQGTSFTVGLTVTDDFYTTFNAHDGFFTYSFQMRRNGTAMTEANTSCVKASTDTANDADVTGVNDFTGPNFVCSVTVPHFNTLNSPINPSDVFDIIATVSDTMSPVVATAATSVQMKWNLTVTEASTAPVIAAFNTATLYAAAGPSTTIYQDGTNLFTATIPETGTIRFRVEVSDTEGDDFQLTVRKYSCTETAAQATPISCSSTSVIYDQLVTNDAGSGSKRVEFTYTGTAAETLIGDPVLATCGGTEGDPTDCIRRIFFKVEAYDNPHVSAQQNAASIDIFQNFSNVNAAPVLAGVQTPAADPTVHTVYSGLPITLNPGTVTDASPNATENSISYGWYIRPVAGAWEVIPGATGSTLQWTPDNLAVDWAVDLEIKMCFSDGSNTYPINNASARCSSSWLITPWNNWNTPTATIPNGNSMAIHRDTSDAFTYYTAFINTLDIHVTKTTHDTASTVATPYNAYNNNFTNLTFTGAGGGEAVEDISMAGDADNLLIAYRYTVAGVYQIGVRRINTYQTAVAPTQQKSLTHYGSNKKFGFDSDGITIDVNGVVGVSSNCDPVTFNCDVAAGIARGNPPTITVPGNTINDPSQIDINGVTFTFDTTTLSSITSSHTICAGCSDSVQASELAIVINASENPLLQGVTAVAAGNTVSIYGSYAADHVDYTASIPSGMGSIAMDATHWYLPFINATQVGANQHKIAFISDDRPTSTQAIDQAEDSAVEYNFLADTLPSTQIKSATYLDTMYIAAIDLNGSGASLYRFTLGTPGGTVAFGLRTSILSGVGAAGFVKIRISPPTANNSFVHVLAQDTSGKWFYGRYNPTTLTPSALPVSEFRVYTNATTVTQTMINDSACTPGPNCDVSDMQIATYEPLAGTSGEARIIMSSDVVTNGVYLPYVMRVKVDTATDTFVVHCDHTLSVNCEQLANISIVPAYPMAIYPTTVSSGGIGTVGATAAETTKPMVLAGFPQGTDLTFMLINTFNESIKPTSRSGSGYYRPALVAD